MLSICLSMLCVVVNILTSLIVVVYLGLITSKSCYHKFCLGSLDTPMGF